MPEPSMTPESLRQGQGVHRHRSIWRAVHGSAIVDRVFGGAAVLWAGAVIVWVCSTAYPHLQDYPECMYQGYLLAALVQGDPVVTQRFALAPYPVPNSFTHVLLGVLTLVVSPIVAGKSVVIVYVVAFTALVARVVYRLDPTSAGKLLLVGVLIFVLNAPFWNGYSNSQYALLFFAGFVYLWHIGQHREPWLVVVFSLLIFFAHAVTFGMFILFIVLTDYAERRQRRWASHGLALLPALALLAWYTFAHTNSLAWTVTDPSKDAGSSWLALLGYKAYTIMKQGPFHLFEFPDRTSHLTGQMPLYRVGIGANVAFAALLGIGFCLGGLARLRRQNTATSPGCHWGFPWAALMLFCLAPQVAFGIVNPGERILLPGCIVLLYGVTLSRTVLTMVCLVILAALPLTASFLIDPQWHRNLTSATAYQRLFTHRPYQLEQRGHFLLHPSREHLLPLGFDTSMVLERQPGRALPADPR